MHITLKIIGGFTGPAGPEVHELDLEQLPPEDARRMRELVSAAQFFSLPETMKKSAPTSWDFLHELTVSDGGKSHTVRFHRDAAPVEVRTLSDSIIALDERRAGHA